MRLKASLAGLAFSVFLLVGGCSRTSAPADAPARIGPEAPNIVLIVIDTLRADHLGCYGYFRDTSPNIDAFARDAIMFENAFAPMATTLPSHVSMFTGLYPLEHGVEANVRHGGKPFGWNPNIRSVAELARDAGYATAGFVSALPLKRDVGFGVGFDVYVEPPGHRQRAEETNAAALPWLERAGKKPFFLFVHFYDPHNQPYMSGPPYSTMFQADEALKAWARERAIPALVERDQCRPRTPTYETMNRYDGEIRYADEQVGRLLGKLRELGLWENSVICFTSDHGEGLNQHDWPVHGRVWREQLHVPLLLRLPPRFRPKAPRRVTELVSLIDLFPTIVSSIEAPWRGAFLQQATGVDVLHEGFRQRPLLGQRSGRDCGDNSGPEFTLMTPRWRLLWDDDSNYEGLFDAIADAHELRNVANLALDPAIEADLEALRRQGHSLVEHLRDRGKSLESGVEQEELSPEMRRDLEALGYIGGGDDDESP